MVYWNRTFIHNEITTIAMAAFIILMSVYMIIRSGKMLRGNDFNISQTNAY